MHITVFCPHCQSRYQLDPSLRGKRMRCPNTICRTVFEVREDVKEPTPTEEDDLEIPGDDEIPSSLAEMNVTAKAPSVDPTVNPQTWEPPPIRVFGKIKPPDIAPSEIAPSLPTINGGSETKKSLVQPARRRTVAVILTMLAILASVLGFGLFLVMDKGTAYEAERFNKAQAFYQNQEFEDAMQGFQKLLRDFPSSKNRRQYDFLAELSAIREAVYAPTPQNAEKSDALDNTLKFLEIYKNDPLLKEHHGDIWNTLQRLARELTFLAEQKQDAGLLEQAKRSWAEADRFTPPSGAKVEDVAKALNADFARVEKVLTERAARLNVLAHLRELTTQGSADAVRAGRALAKKAALENDPDVATILKDLVQAHRAKIVFTPADNGTPRPTEMVPEDVLPSFYIAPRVGKFSPLSQRFLKDQSGVVLALARGVLYALDSANGDILWVRRVGVDTNLLPLRIPSSPSAPEMILVVSSDNKSFTAVEAHSGNVIWQHALSAVCLGQPVLVDHSLLVPTLSGQVEEVETTAGAYQGSYALGQPLLLGGVHQPGTTLVYFPAESYSVYVLDLAKRECAAILYSGHPSGSLRGLPAIWNENRSKAENAKGEGWLLLSLAYGNDGVTLRPYALPIRQPDQNPAKLTINVSGDCWANPWHDSEKLALATDAGLLAVFGIRQKGNRDPLLFPFFPEQYRLENKEQAGKARPMVIHADADNFWASSGGRLHRLQYIFTSASGPGLVARWPQPLDLGAPLHAGQVREVADGHSVLFLATQDRDRPTCWIRAVDAEQGLVLWQRQLGMVCQDQPLAAGDTVLCTDPDFVFLFEANRFASEKGWQAGGTAAIEAVHKHKYHWALARGTDFVYLNAGPEPVLTLRILDRKGVKATRTYPLPALPQGSPALGSDFVLIPLANGIVFRVPLEEGTPTNGPEWRGLAVEEFQPGHIVALGNNDFAITDGNRSLMRIRWKEDKNWDKIAEVELPHRITAAPALLGNHLFVADASDTVTMLEGEHLTAVRRWSPGGKITAGPFVRGQGVGMEVGKNRLVWLDPAKDQPAWEYTFVAPIVGQPEMIGDLLVVADLQGGIHGFSPATGNPAGSGYRLKANQAPSAAPVAFGPGQIFLPLMDGTAMVLPLDKLR